MNKLINLFKPISVTPLQLIKKYQEKYPKYKNVKMGYAGRLDPMAEGVLIVLVSKENKNKIIYEKLNKEYEFSVLFGVSTDSYDIMGKITEIKKVFKIDRVKITGLLKNYIGSFDQEYPPYSSATVSGKPLYYWARAGKIKNIKLPFKRIRVESLEIISEDNLKASNLYKLIEKRVTKVEGEFRQMEILEDWRVFLGKNDKQIFPILNFKISCSSGTYIRSFANNFGNELKIPSLALNIKRTKVGNYFITDSLTVY